MRDVRQFQPFFEFHISRQSREKYQVDDRLFGFDGQVIFANFHAARLLAQQLNQKRDVLHHPEKTARASELSAMGLMDEIFHYLFQLYRQEKNPQVLEAAWQWLESRVGKEALEETIRQFVDTFPNTEVYRGEMTTEAFLNSQTEGIPHRLIILEEIIMLWLANMNPALHNYRELFDDTPLKKSTAYSKIISELHSFFDRQPFFGPDNQNLMDMFRAPAIAVPDSIPGQLEYIRTRWASLLGKFLLRLLQHLDLIREEEKARFLGPGPAKVYEFIGLEEEPERFSPDRDWMPNLVLIAKSTLVWLDQLSRKYQRPITRLDQIPDEELDTLARWGFTGLWLIGIWERSRASKKIKQLCGNPEAEASAYSLYDYIIARELGGEEAYENLKQRCWQRGIRLASDMVPNHTGIDSRWVMEHPDWFIYLDYPPFPGYSYNGPNLSENPAIGIYIEDHYYDRTDAAVTFKRVDFHTGDVKYIYHGNDGTSMPWNDTAQLNYLKPEVREAVIQTILRVARMFPIIRFDAAMTLTKKHYQRLWFPEPGTGGDIPSRAEFGMTREEFNRHMPQEFWREVVDRVAQEAPDTLLLAEAFWLMEGYFVRTLGMHRVYNSAFMNMLKNEDNANYRKLMKNTLEFNPEILKRYVNFMNNPDEETAVVQFGKGDKYFGVCTMMVTLPGLPMFGHGQVEGFAEKYGMEYRRAYWDEQPDAELIARHEREIFPLMKKRYLFAEVQNFLLYDFFTPDGTVNEDVFAYSNRAGQDRSLVVYHNRFAEARGWVRTSVAFLQKDEQGNEQLVQKSLAEGLGLPNDPNCFVVFRDHIAGLEFIRNCAELWEKGLFIELGAYKYHVFLDFQEWWDDDTHRLSRLTAELQGRGVPSMQQALRELQLRPIYSAYRELLNWGAFQWFFQHRVKLPADVSEEKFESEFRQKFTGVLTAIRSVTGLEFNPDAILNEVLTEFHELRFLPVWKEKFPYPRSRKYSQALRQIQQWLGDSVARWAILWSWLWIHAIGRAAGEENAPQQTVSWFSDWMLGNLITEFLQSIPSQETRAEEPILLLRILLNQQSVLEQFAENRRRPFLVLKSLLEDPEVAAFLKINQYQQVIWFNKERFEEMANWLLVVWAVHRVGMQPENAAHFITDTFKIMETWLKAEQQSEYQVEKLLAWLKKKR